ncbi:heme lyase CcmF/NrfE family subunit [Anaplasma bovis]|uniref:heme lyase CcmF/NrfE family subunit n=1 Tax=Anaplasma bovis TaxID=186733 RepID=UPI002FF173F8
MLLLSDGGSISIAVACVLSLLYPFVAKVSVKLGSLLTYLVCSLHCGAFFLLIYCRVSDDFSLEHVYSSSHSMQPLLYKIFGVWGNYEGSSFLFTCLLSIYAVLLNICVRQHNHKAVALSVQHLFILGFSLFTLWFANPFSKIFVLDDDGLGFNPMLQDVAITIHPPVLFAGYAGFSAVLSLTIAAVVLQQHPTKWASDVRIWAITAWTALTAGIALGSWWAYRELGWGGFWSWDPVENVVLMPWLIGTALIHMLPVVRRCGIYCNFTIFLAITACIASLYSTFFVRSGLLISVHTFAHDVYRGTFLLALVSIIAALCLATFIVFYRKVEEYCSLGYLSKISVILGNSIIMITACSVVLLGITYPIFVELLSGDTVSIGARYYSGTFCILTNILMVMMIALASLSWTGTGKLICRYKISSFFAIVFAPVAFTRGQVGITLLLAAFLFCALVENLFNKLRHASAQGLLSTYMRPQKHAMFLAHLGVAVLVFGVVYSGTYQDEVEKYMQQGESVNIHGFEVTLSDVSFLKNKYYEAIRGNFVIKNGNKKKVKELFPEDRYYPVERSRNTESSVYHGMAADIYVVIGDIYPEKGIAVRIHYKPLIMLVWIGFALGVIGGILGILKAIVGRSNESSAHTAITP